MLVAPGRRNCINSEHVITGHEVYGMMHLHQVSEQLTFTSGWYILSDLSNGQHAYDKAIKVVILKLPESGM